MTSCNENDNENRSHKEEIDPDVDIKTNTQSTACLDKIISLCNKQHLSL